VQAPATASEPLRIRLRIAPASGPIMAAVIQLRSSSIEAGRGQADPAGNTVVVMASKRRNIRKRTTRRPAPSPASPPWKRPLVWTGSVAGALILAAATAFGTGLGQKLLGTAASRST
jgi:hypothetical protein